MAQKAELDFLTGRPGASASPCWMSQGTPVRNSNGRCHRPAGPIRALRQHVCWLAAEQAHPEAPKDGERASHPACSQVSRGTQEATRTCAQSASSPDTEHEGSGEFTGRASQGHRVAQEDLHPGTWALRPPGRELLTPSTRAVWEELHGRDRSMAGLRAGKEKQGWLDEAAFRGM